MGEGRENDRAYKPYTDGGIGGSSGRGTQSGGDSDVEQLEETQRRPQDLSGHEAHQRVLCVGADCAAKRVIRLTILKK